jgi:ABC-2 type transport system permease protein
MNKLFAVFKREYFQAVRKKMFIVMTFLMPVFMIGLFILPGMLMSKGMGQKKIAVVDGTGQLSEAFTGEDNTAGSENTLSRRSRDVPQQIEIEYVNAAGNPVDKAATPYLERMQSKGTDRLDGVFLVPAGAVTAIDTKLKYYSRSATDIMVQERLSRRTNRAVQRNRFVSRGVAEKDLETLMTDLEVESVQLSKSGQQKKGGIANFIVGFILTALLLIPSFIYGLEIMRGIIQEKTDRVVEVLVSSMSSSQLLIGKILGIAAVGLTQISVWLAMAAVAGGYAGATAAMAGENFLQLLRPSTFVYFVIFFLLAYLTYVCVYAIGGAVCNSEKEAQQLIAPITMIMMLPWFLMAGIITNPESSLSVGFSLAPVFGPLTMYVRTLVSEPPMWHVLLSIAIAIATIAVFFWVTAKIFHIGILSYGKRPTIPELLRWVRVA